MKKLDVENMKAEQTKTLDAARAKVEAEYAIPPLLGRVRAEIQDLDVQLVAMLRRRTMLAELAELVKRSAGLDVHDPARERKLLDLYTPQEGPEREAYAKVINVCREHARRVREQASLPGPQPGGDQEAPETRPEGR